MLEKLCPGAVVKADTYPIPKWACWGLNRPNGNRESAIPDSDILVGNS
jgi:hypothetical protein